MQRTNIPDNEVYIIQHHAAEIFIIIHMGSLQHFQIRGILAGAENTKTTAGKRVLPITQEVANMFRAIIEDRPKYKVEKVVQGYSGFLFLDKNGMPLVAMHWEHRFRSMLGRYNEIYKVQMPKITPHVYRHTDCSNMAKSGMNSKTLQYLMGLTDKDDRPLK